MKNMRKLFSGFAILAISVGFLTACGNDQSDNPSDSNEVLPSLKVTKNGDDAPTVSYDKDAKIKVEVTDEANGIGKDIIKVLDKGDGAEIKAGQMATISHVDYAMPGMNETSSTWADKIAPELMPLLTGDGVVDDLSSAIIGLKVGAVLGVARPGFKTDGTTLDTSGTNYSLEVLVIVDAKEPVTRADGADVPASSLDAKLPKVTLASDGTPSVDIPKGFASPTATITERLKIGTGEKVTFDKNVSLAYSTWNLATGEKIDSTWGNQPLTVSLNSVNAGWQEALNGATVGSQYLVIVPKSIAQNATINSDIVCVIDVLDVN